MRPQAFLAASKAEKGAHLDPESYCRTVVEECLFLSSDPFPKPALPKTSDLNQHMRNAPCLEC